MARVTAWLLSFAVACGACTVERRPDGEPGPDGPVRPEPTPDAHPTPTPHPTANGEGSPLSPEQEKRRLAALAKLRAGDVATGRAALRALADEAGPSYALYHDCAVAAGMAEDWLDAEGWADKALAIQPDAVEAQANRIEAMLALGDRTGALDRGEALVERHPESAAAQVALGQAYLALMRLADARKAYESALDRQPDDAVAAIGVLAVAAYDLSAVEARELGEKLLQPFPDDPYVLHLMAVTEERRQETKAARALYLRAIAAAEQRKDPADRGPLAWSHYNLGQLLEAEDGLDAARPHYQAFLALAPPTGQLERENLMKKLGLAP
ncbi:MAG: tetratricopeptide repeat protein [Myxococcota bacterium]